MALPTLDAVFASAADQPRRMMLAKWLVEELGETQAPSSVLVSGAGSLSVNGIYVYDGTYNGKGKWRLSEFVYLHSEDLGDGPSWYIYDDNIGRMYGLISDTEYPWQGTYVSGFDGELPAPTAIEVPAASPISNYHDLPERYLWAKIAVAAGGPKTEADYISLPKQYVWKAIYDAVSGSSLGTIDWSEKQALGHIAAAYRGDTGNPANLATYIDWPWRYQVASIITQLASEEPIPNGNGGPTTFNAVIVSGAGSELSNDTYTERGEYNDKSYYIRIGDPDLNGDNISNSTSIYWVEAWIINNSSDGLLYFSEEDVEFPWLIETWTALNGIEPPPTLTPTNV
jgi:hypothetical protein